MKPFRIVSVLTGDTRCDISYEDHRASRWFVHHIKRQALHKAGNRCRKCQVAGNIEEIEVYHRSLKRLGTVQELEDVVVMCRPCRESYKGRAIPPFTEDRSEPTHVRYTIWKIMEASERSA